MTGFEEGWKIIIKFLNQIKKLRVLNLSMSYLYDKYIDDIFKSLKNKKLTNLDLSSNFITSSGARIIAKWLSKNKTIKYLNLEQNTMNEFKRDGADLILESLKLHPRIAFLDLSHMMLTGLGEKTALFLKSTQSLKSLKLRNVRMNVDDHNYLFSALLENETLEILDIGENATGIDKSVEHLSNAIEKATKLKDLNIDKFGITKKMYEVFFNALKKNKSLVKIYLNENKIPLTALLAALQEKETPNILKEVYTINKDYELNASEKTELKNFQENKKEIKLHV